MIREDCDVAIVGAGFAGSVLALVLQRAGLRPLVLERGSHPRFAIGESSTPLANLSLEELARDYDLPQLHGFSEYGRWLRAYPHLACGLKRGFSYFAHRPGQPFQPEASHSNQLLVAASPNDEVSDTHWFREQFDAFLASEVQAAGIPYLDRTLIAHIDHGNCWELSAQRDGAPVEVRAAFLIDATGPAGFLARALDIDTRPIGLGTNSWSVYTHFEGVDLWENILRERGGDTSCHPFPCDAAALHHVLEEGWIWVLRLNNGVTSAGIAFNGEVRQSDPARSPEEEWQELLTKYPSLARHFRDARAVQPWVRTGRLQRRASRAVGPDWALLPHSAYFLDALFSSGNAHALHGIQRLACILVEHWSRPTLGKQLTSYECALFDEIKFLDMLIHGCFRTLSRFDLFTSYTMYYFAGAITCEKRRRAGVGVPTDGFFLAHDPIFRRGLEQSYQAIASLPAVAPLPSDFARAFHEQVARNIGPFNTAGLADVAKANMYPFV
jgi:FADH2 O2-dependent halogenase